MSIESRRPTTDDIPNAWHVEKKVDEAGIYVRITPEVGVRANEVIHAAQVRKIAMGVLRGLGFEQRMDEVELVLGEFAANGIEHGDGIDEVGIAYRPETLEVKTVNQLSPGARLVSKSERGQLINDMPNDKAEDGRGLQLTEALADEWDQAVESGQVVTYARFRPIRQESEQTPPRVA